MIRSAVLALCLLCAVAPAAGRAGRTMPSEIPGPVEARVVRVIDGDTFVAEALVWPGHAVRVSVRIRGIDAPEMRSRCAKERRAAEDARAALAGLLRAGPVAIRNIRGDKYFGRVLADVAGGDGRDVGSAMLRFGMARVYDGRKRQNIC